MIEVEVAQSMSKLPDVPDTVEGNGKGERRS